MRNFGLALLLTTALPILAAPTRDEIQKRADAYIAPLLEQSVFSGVVLLAKGDEILLHRGYGNANYEFGIPNTKDTRFGIASITKHFTGIVLRRLEQEKKLSLTDPLSKYVPSFPRADKITLEHLRTHRSGLRDPEKLRRTIRMNYSTAEVVGLLATETFGSEPGAEYSYTTANYAILAHVIEKVTGEPYSRVVERMIYVPAGMKDSGELIRTTVVPRLASGYMPDPYGDGVSVCGPEDTSWKAGGGSSYSTVRDLHKYVRAFYGGRLTPGLDPRAMMQTSKTWEKDVYRSSGGFPGASANLVYFIDDELTIAVTSNNYAPLASSVVDALAAIWFEKPYANPELPSLSKTPVDATPIVGTYKMGSFPPFTISLREGKAILTWNPVRMSPLVATGPDTWFEKFDWMTLKTERDEKGNVTGFTATAPWSAEPLKVIRIP